jgi:uncharacterized protein YjbI with pentapeptide repeats
MAQRTITTDDLTGAIIEGDVKKLTLSLAELTGEKTSEKLTLDVSLATLSAIHEMVKGDASEFASLLNANLKNARKTTGSDLAAETVRTWARENGIAVNEKGRVPAEIVAKYRAAHPVS